MSNPLNNPMFIKGISAFGYSFLIDKFVFQNEDMTQNATFSAAVAGGIIAGQVAAKTIVTSGLLPDQEGLYNGKLLSMRMVELTVGATSGFLINSYVLNNEYDRSNYMKKLAAIIAVDIASEYTVDYVVGNNLGYFVE